MTGTKNSPKKEISKVHPNHYLIHKYWSRKPHNIISNYVSHFTKEGDTILDPFMGSGVTILESLKLGRKPIGVDLNPISVFLVKSATNYINIDKLIESFKKISKEIEKFNEEYYITNCSICNKKSLVENNLFFENVRCDSCGESNVLKECNRRGSKYFCKNCESPLKRINGNINYQLRKIRGTCDSCGTFIKEPSKKDALLMNKIHKKFTKKKNASSFWVPEEKISGSIKRSGKEKLYELFSERNLLGINKILENIRVIRDKKIKELMLLTLTSCVSSASRMIPANEKTITGKSGWQIPKYYIFPTHIEKNIFEAFKERFRRNLKGISELSKLKFKYKSELYNKSSKNMDFIGTNSVDYIFTDPPYGDTIQYLSLSGIWNSLIEKKADFNEEIIIDKNRGKNLKSYESDLLQSFKECSRVLKKEKFLTVTFNAKDMKIFGALIRASLKAGFSLKEVSHQDFAVSSATQGLNWRTTLKGDFILVFRNEKKPQKIKGGGPLKLKEEIIKHIRTSLKKEEMEFGEIFSLIMPKIILRGYLNKSFNLDLYSLIENNFQKRREGKKIFWKIKN